MANEFLTFAADGGANVITQAAYDALAARDTGFASGVAQSNQLNKVWRQGAAMAAALGEVIDDNGGNALDDGNLPNLVAAIKAAFTGTAVLSANGSAAIPFPGIGTLQIRWGTVAIPSGSNVGIQAFSFDTPFPTACFGVYGNADKVANFEINCVVVVFSSQTLSGAVANADTAQGGSTEPLQSGINVKYFAIGI